MGSRPTKGETVVEDLTKSSFEKVREENESLKKQLDKLDQVNDAKITQLKIENENLRKQNEELLQQIADLRTQDNKHVEVNDAYLRVDQWVSEQSASSDSGRSSMRLLSSSTEGLCETQPETANNRTDVDTPITSVNTVTENRSISLDVKTTQPAVEISNRSVSLEGETMKSKEQRKKEKRRNLKTKPFTFRQMSDIDAYGQGLPLPDAKKHSRANKEKKRLRREYSIDKNDVNKNDDSSISDSGGENKNQQKTLKIQSFEEENSSY